MSSLHSLLSELAAVTFEWARCSYFWVSSLLYFLSELAAFSFECARPFTVLQSELAAVFLNGLAALYSEGAPCSYF